MKSKLLSAVCAAATMLAFSARADGGPTTDPGAIAVDVLIGRPACLVATVVGSAVFVVALPLAAASGGIDSAADSLVVKPARATFVRPLGDWNYSEEYAASKSKSKKAIIHSPKQQAQEAPKQG